MNFPILYKLKQDVPKDDYWLYEFVALSKDSEGHLEIRAVEYEEGWENCHQRSIHMFDFDSSHWERYALTEEELVQTLLKAV